MPYFRLVYIAQIHLRLSSMLRSTILFWWTEVGVRPCFKPQEGIMVKILVSLPNFEIAKQKLSKLILTNEIYRKLNIL